MEGNNTENTAGAAGPPEVMNVEEAAAYLGLGVRTVYKLAQSGEVPAAKVAGSWRFPKADIDHWLSERAQANLRNR